MKRGVFVALMIVIAGAAAAEAQQEDRPTREERRQRFAAAVAVPTVGVRASYDLDDRHFGIGGQAQIPLGTVLRFVPSMDVFFGDETTWQANGDVALSLLLLRAGGGIALVDARRVDGDGTEVGLNLFVGVQGPRPRARVRPFAEARWTLLPDDTLFRLAAGVNVPIRGAR
jgi:hypothetical protein